MATLTPTEQQAVGGQSLVGGGFRSAAPPQFAAPTPTPTSTPTRTTPTTTAAPTTSGVLTPDQQARLQDITTQAQALEQQVNNLAGQEPTVGQSLEGVGGGLDAGPSFTDIYGEEPNERDITRNQMRLFQQEIDATNQVFDQMLNQARLEGTGRLGSQRAVAARGGLLGSDFAGAQKQRVQDFNTDINQGIQAERTAAIGAIMGNVRSAVQDEIREKRLARQQGAENYLSWLANKDQRDANNAQLIASDLINLGVDPSTLSPEELQTITQEAGIAPESVLRTYRQLQAEQEAAEAESGANEFGFMSTSGGVFRTNPQTGEAEFIASPGAGGTITGTSGGGSGTGDTEEPTGFNAGRQIIADNPQLSDAEIKAALLENTDLNVSEINSLIDTRTNRQISGFETKVDQIAEAIFNNVDTIEEAEEFVNKGTITSNGKQFQLTPEQQQQLEQAIQDQRSFFQKLVPGGK